MNTSLSESAQEKLLAARSRIAVAAIFFVNGFAFASWVPHIPTVQARLGLNPGLLGLALFGVALGSLLSMPLTGPLVAKWGSRKVTIIASLLFCAVVSLPVRAPSFPLFVLSLVAFGAFSAAMDVAMNAHGVTIEKKLERPIMSSLHALFSIGGLAGAGCSIPILALGVTPAAHMTGIAALGLVLILAASRFLLEVPPAKESGAGHTFALPTGPLLFLGLMAFMILMTEGAMADWSAVYLRQSLGAGAAVAGAGYAVFSMAMATGRLTGDRLVRRFGPATLLRIGGGASACAMGLALLFHSPAAAMIGFACVGLGLSNMIPITFSAAGRTPDVAPGTAIAAVSTTGYGGFLAGPPLLGFVANISGLPTAMGLLALFMAVIALSARSFGAQSQAA